MSRFGQFSGPMMLFIERNTREEVPRRKCSSDSSNLGVHQTRPYLSRLSTIGSYIYINGESSGLEIWASSGYSLRSKQWMKLD